MFQHSPSSFQYQLAFSFALISHAIFKHANFTTMFIPIVLLVLFPVFSVMLSSYIEDASPSILSLLEIVLFYYFSLATSIVIYRLSPLHPLYSFPGPRVARASKLYGVWISSTGKQHVTFKRLHDEYGPVVRTGPNELSISDVDGVSKVFGANGLPKGEYYAARADPHSPANLNSLNDEEHANRRRIWNRGFSTEAMQEYNEMIARRAELLVEKIGAIEGVVNLSAWLSYFQFDFMGDMSFSGGFEMLRAGYDDEGLSEIIRNFFHIVSPLTHVPWLLKTIAHLPVTTKDVKKLHKFGADRAVKRIESGSLNKDLWYHLTDEAGLEKEKPALNDVIADGALAVVAGGDTTSRAIQNVFFSILANPKYYEQLQNEIDVAFPSGEGVFDVDRYSDLKLLDAIVNESLRLYPPIPTNGPRRVSDASKTRIVCNRLIPVDTEIYVPPYALQRDPRYFSPSPNEFIPERWFTDKTDPSFKFILNQTAFIPFSYGPQNCAGRNLARNEIKMVTAYLMSKFDFEFAAEFDKNGWEDTLCDYFIMHPDKPVLVTLKKRRASDRPPVLL